MAKREFAVATAAAVDAGRPETTSQFPGLATFLMGMAALKRQRGDAPLTQRQALQCASAWHSRQHQSGARPSGAAQVCAPSGKTYSMSGSCLPHQKVCQDWPGGLAIKSWTDLPGSGPLAAATAPLPTLTTAEMAWWSLPPSPSVLALTMEPLPMLLKTLSTPPQESPLYTCKRCGQRDWTVDEPAFALKSPTRMMRSPGAPRLAMSCKMLFAVARPPQRPPEFTESGPWWFTKRAVLPLTRCFRRIHTAPRLPYQRWGMSSATSSVPCASTVQAFLL
mmetsp:Transcript_62777/g.167685  ORF Transcript_62777/g.167685 Transcript_62777/m.167685 type:complete len:278 (-) Transcript_62777:330-1163(-)